MSDLDNNTRLAKLEASFEIIKELLKEIREDAKTLPTDSDYSKIEDRISAIEKTQTTLVIKIGVGGGIVGIIGGLIIKMLF